MFLWLDGTQFKLDHKLGLHEVLSALGPKGNRSMPQLKDACVDEVGMGL